MFSKRLGQLRHRVRYTCAVFPKNQNKANSSSLPVGQSEQLLYRHTLFGGIRYASSNAVVPPVITKAIEAASPVSDNATQPSSLDSLIESIGPIPDVPGPPGPKLLEILANGEPSLKSLGIGGWTPSGILQQIVEAVHLYGDFSWATSVVLVAVIARILLFKVLVRQRQESAKLSMVMPQLQFLQQKLTEARQKNDIIEASRYAMELSEFSKSGQVTPFGVFKYALVQGFVLVSFTQALRTMCYLPVESMKTGGFGTFIDLTVSDPTYTLPFVNAFLLYLHLATGKELFAMFPNRPYVVHCGMLGMSAVVFGFGVNFPNAIVLYWISSLCVTVVQHKILALPKVSKYFDLQPQTNQKVAEMMKAQLNKDAQKKKNSKLSFWAQMKEGQANNRLAAEVKQRADLDSAAFERAGREPLRKTYKFDVTKMKK